MIYLCTHILYLMMVEWNDLNMLPEDNNKRTYNVRVNQGKLAIIRCRNFCFPVCYPKF